MRHTLESIAKLAGVSRGTVSRVINGQPGVKPEVKRRVLLLIEETGFTPNHQARSLASGRTENIGVVVFGHQPLFLGHHLFFEVLQGIQSHSTLNAYDMLLFSNRGDFDQQYWKQVADKRKVDGLIIMGEDIREEYLEYYYQKKIPFVLVGKRDFKNVPLICVTSDYRKGAYLAVSHLVERKRSRLLLISGIAGTFHDNERLAGARQALYEAGIPPSQTKVIQANALQLEACDKTELLLREGERFDGIFAGNDLMAFGAMEALRRFGLSVPEEVSVIGYDDIQAAAYSTPPLTSVRQDKIRLGETASELLMKLLKQEIDVDQPLDILLDNELIVRGST